MDAAERAQNNRTAFHIEPETAAPTDNRPAFRLRGGVDARPDIIQDWQRVSKRGIFDFGSAEWRRVGAAVKAVAEQPGSIHRLRDVLTALQDWYGSKDGRPSVRDSVVEQLRERVVDDLDGLAGSPTTGGRMRVATHPADDEAEARADSAVAEATQRMVASGRDLQVARWMLSANPELVVAEAQDELELLRTAITRHGDTSEEPISGLGLTRMWAEQIERVEEDLQVFDAMRSRSPHAWERLREPQAAALVVVERRGRQVAERDYQATVARLRHESWARVYASLDPEDLAQTAHEHLRLNGRLVTNMSPRRLDALLADPEGIFRNYWETGTTEAAKDSNARATAEQDMGYAAIVGEGAQASAPAVQQARDLPKYAALLSPLRPEGLLGYGEIAFVWNADVRARSTFTPKDSMDCSNSAEGARSATGSDHLYPLLAYGDDDVVRLVFAEATEFAYDDELRAMFAAGVPIETYAETYFEGQIHGDLFWSDLDEIRICHPPGCQDVAAGNRDRIQAYAHQRGLDLRVEPHLIGNPPAIMSTDSHAADRDFAPTPAKSDRDDTSDIIAGTEYDPTDLATRGWSIMDNPQASDPWGRSGSGQGSAGPQPRITSHTLRRRAGVQAKRELGSASNRGKSEEVQGMGW